MPCLCQKPRSLYWMVKYRDSTGRIVMRSTKEKVYREALKIALAWEDSATKARAGELTQAASVKVLRELMEQSLGETLKTPSVRETLNGYLDACKATGGAASTQARYRPLFTRFLSHIGQVRARASASAFTLSAIE